jgi:hypothetical protein
MQYCCVSTCGRVKVRVVDCALYEECVLEPHCRCGSVARIVVSERTDVWDGCVGGVRGVLGWVTEAARFYDSGYTGILHTSHKKIKNHK